MSRTWVLAKKCANCMTWPFQELTRESNGEYGSFRRHSSESVSFRMQEFQPGASGRPLARPPFFLGFEVAALACGHVVQAPSKIQSFNVQASSSPPNIISSRVHFANDLRMSPYAFVTSRVTPTDDESHFVFPLQSDLHDRGTSAPPLPTRAAPGQLSFVEIQKALHLVGQLPENRYYIFGKPDRALHVSDVVQHPLQPSGPPALLRAPRNRSG